MLHDVNKVVFHLTEGDKYFTQENTWRFTFQKMNGVLCANFMIRRCHNYLLLTLLFVRRRLVGTRKLAIRETSTK